MRGKLRRYRKNVKSFGITPADAGKTDSEGYFFMTEEDHPRGCGENLPSLSRGIGLRGSPPRMRGKLMGAVKKGKASGITPADAGKTIITQKNDCQHEDHPRGCGENGISFPTLLFHQGSPPRMRGKHVCPVKAAGRAGITPADAGKTSRPFQKVRQAQDHPRGCGENCRKIHAGAFRRGSPPRMRGKLQRHRSSSPRQGITPADAGKT